MMANDLAPPEISISISIVVVMNLRSCAPGRLWPTVLEPTCRVHSQWDSYITWELGHVY
jgi:hypothetical protein